LYSQVPSAGHVWAVSGTSVSLLIAEIMTQACVTLQAINQGEQKIRSYAGMNMKQLISLVQTIYVPWKLRYFLILIKYKRGLG
jgi:hypothetical protein